MDQKGLGYLRLMRTLRAIWIQCGIVLVTIVVLDTLLRVYFYATAKPRPDPRAAADGYKNCPWAPEYFADLAGFSVRWNRLPIGWQRRTKAVT